VEAGIDVIQLRERDLDDRALYALTVDVVALASGSGSRVVVNDRLDVALAAGAHGVHLRADSVPVAAVRRAVPPGFLVGRSVHDADEAGALEPGADYLIAGAVWPTVSKPPDHPLLGVNGLTQIVRSCGVPVLAIGGVTLDHVREVAESGAAGAAAIGLFISPDGAADTTGRCGAGPLHDLARRARELYDDIRPVR
jgi:thiamine-phosphate pyrophosphorylase